MWVISKIHWTLVLRKSNFNMRMVNWRKFLKETSWTLKPFRDGWAVAFCCCCRFLSSSCQTRGKDKERCFLKVRTAWEIEAGGEVKENTHEKEVKGLALTSMRAKKREAPDAGLLLTETKCQSNPWSCHKGAGPAQSSEEEGLQGEVCLLPEVQWGRMVEDYEDKNIGCLPTEWEVIRPEQ